MVSYPTCPTLTYRILCVCPCLVDLTRAVFCRQHIFIPLLPSKLLVYLTAPTPYLVGIRRYTLDEAKRSRPLPFHALT